MRLVAVVIFRRENGRDPLALWSHFELSFLNFWQRGPVKEHIMFHSRLVCSKTAAGEQTSVQFEKDLGFCHCYPHSSGLSATVIADKEYPPRVAYTFISQLLKKFHAVNGEKWPTAEEGVLEFPEGVKMFKEFEDPAEADKVYRVQQELEEVRSIMLKNMKDLVERGEDLETLMEKSSDLSATSREFYKAAQKTESCCRWY